jgi:cellulose biosynthesis protein BcsQ
MAPGGGRGWFHRRRHEPEPEQSNGTTHAGASTQRDTDSSAQSGTSVIPAPQREDHSQWSPEARGTAPASSSIGTAGTARETRESARADFEQATYSPSATSQSSHEQVADPPPQLPSIDPVPVPSGDEHRPVDDHDQGTQFRSAEHPRQLPTTPIDWDAATAAALSDEPEPQGATGTPHASSGSTADRLLEDIIREIVGDAAVDAVSSLHPPRTASQAPTADQAPPATSTIIEADSPLQAVQADPLAAPEATLQPSPPTAIVTGSGSAIDAAADLETPAESAPTGEPDAGSGDVSVTASATNGQPLTESGSSAAPHVGPTSQPESSPPPGPEPRFPSTPEFTSSTDMAMQPSTESDTTPGFPPAGVPDDADATSPAEASEQSDHHLPASWPSEASIVAATTGRGVESDVSRETMETPLDLPVSRETATEHGGTPLADQIADETRRRLALDEAVLPLPPSTRILTISNQKGGVGKTTTAVNLSAALARTGAHVLVIDLDPQGNASTALGVDHRSEQLSVYEVLVSDLPLSEVIRPSTEHEHLDCVPATIHLAGAEIELVSLVAREQRLRRALDNHLATMERPYDYVFIDCPPSLGLLTINAFVAAREVLIPIQCEYYALEGLSQLLSNIELIEKHLNSDLRLSTILLTMYDSRTNLAQQVAQEVRDHFPSQTLHTIIPRSVRVSEAPSYGQSVISYDFASTGSLSYREAAAEIARRSASNSKETTDGN